VTVIANKPPTQMPVLQGLINETATKTTSAMERRIKSLEDQLKAAVGKTPNRAKISKGNRKKSLQQILKKKGTPAATKKLLPPALPPALKKPTAKVPCTKGKKKAKRCKVSFDGKKAVKPTNLHK
jgi:hypothetical protein